jgi:hypothetical protein
VIRVSQTGRALLRMLSEGCCTDKFYRKHYARLVKLGLVTEKPVRGFDGDSWHYVITELGRKVLRGEA